MLAGWVRVFYPDIIFAAVSSSAPVHAKLEMVEYNDIAARAYTIGAHGVGGSPACRDAIAEGHARIGDMMNSTEGRQALLKLFPAVRSHGGVDWLRHHDGQRDFASEGVAYFPSQGNDPACDDFACNIGRICQVMTDATSTASPVERLAKIAAGQAAQRRGLAQVAVGRRTLHETLDYWGYQTCTEARPRPPVAARPQP